VRVSFRVLVLRCAGRWVWWMVCCAAAAPPATLRPGLHDCHTAAAAHCLVASRPSSPAAPSHRIALHCIACCVLPCAVAVRSRAAPPALLLSHCALLLPSLVFGALARGAGGGCVARPCDTRAACAAAHALCRHASHWRTRFLLRTCRHGCWSRMQQMPHAVSAARTCLVGLRQHSRVCAAPAFGVCGAVAGGSSGQCPCWHPFLRHHAPLDHFAGVPFQAVARLLLSQTCGHTAAAALRHCNACGGNVRACLIRRIVASRRVVPLQLDCPLMCSAGPAGLVRQPSLWGVTLHVRGVCVGGGGGGAGGCVGVCVCVSADGGAGYSVRATEGYVVRAPRWRAAVLTLWRCGAKHAVVCVCVCNGIAGLCDHPRGL
jgi:hypothetical protein